MDDFRLEDWFPMSPLQGPPLPKILGIYWPWYKGEGPPPGGYTCPYCGANFATYGEVASHIQSAHPGERIPIEITWVGVAGLPILAPGSSRAARAPITAKPAGMACQAELFLGPDPATKTATSGMVAFTSTGVSQDVNLPVTMPTPAAGEGAAYHVYIDVYAGGAKFLSYIATEDVVIPGGSIGAITWT